MKMFMAFAPAMSSPRFSLQETVNRIFAAEFTIVTKKNKKKDRKEMISMSNIHRMVWKTPEPSNHIILDSHFE